MTRPAVRYVMLVFGIFTVLLPTPWMCRTSSPFSGTRYHTLALAHATGDSRYFSEGVVGVRDSGLQYNHVEGVTSAPQLTNFHANKRGIGAAGASGGERVENYEDGADTGATYAADISIYRSQEGRLGEAHHLQKRLSYGEGMRRMLGSKKGDRKKYWSTSGNQIVDGKSRVIKFSGINWNGLDNQRCELDGLDFRSLASSMDQMASLGFNLIRLDFSTDCLLQGSSVLKKMDDVVNGAQERGMRVILSNIRLTYQTLTAQAITGVWFNDTLQFNSTVTFTENVWIENWRRLAERYAGNPTVVGVDLFNGPHAEYGTTPVWGAYGMGGNYNWRIAAKRASDAVQEVNPDLLICVSGISDSESFWGENHEALLNYPLELNIPNKLVYTVHEYGPLVDKSKKRFNVSNFPKNLPAYWSKTWAFIHSQNIAPVWIAEWGSNMNMDLSSNQTPDERELKWVYEFRDFIRENGLSWTWFTWGDKGSDDTGGILKTDWQTPHQEKLDLIAPILYTLPRDGESSSFPKNPIIVAAVLIFALTVGTCIFCFHKKRSRDQDDIISLEASQRFTFEELRRATNDFSNDQLLGEGTYGRVYRGVAPNGAEWAVKRAKGLQRKSVFIREVELVSGLSHRNIVRLLGYCDERRTDNKDQEQLLVYELIPNGSLRDRLSKDSDGPLSFRQRLDVAIDIAEGLHYLHSFSTPSLVHRDIKPENILLDSNMRAKIADFGIVREVPSDAAGGITRTHVAGTFEYMDPEYIREKRPSTAIDVYSYGIVLWEIFSGITPLDTFDSDGKKIIPMRQWVSKHLNDKSTWDMVDISMKLTGEEFSIESFVEIMELGLECTRIRGLDRPSVDDVSHKLKAIRDKLYGRWSPPKGGDNFEAISDIGSKGTTQTSLTREFYNLGSESSRSSRNI